MENYHYIIVISKARMILHFYTVKTPLRYSRIHNGHGLGSLFAKLFGKIASKTVAKTALKTALSAAKTIGKKALKETAKEIVPLAKEGIKEAAKYGVEKAVEGINTIATKAVNKGVPSDLVHKIKSTVESGVKRQAENFSIKAGDKLESGIKKVVDIPSPPRKKKKRNTKIDQRLFDAL